MAVSFSPLRYPGGKQILARVIGHLIKLNGLEGAVYVEPYAGGAGAALSLLFGEHVRNVVINDADSRVHAFWDAALNRTNELVKLIRDTPLTVEEWRRQRALYLNPGRASRVRVGFAAFYLNRCNRSGIIGNAGLIGGIKQTGEWKLDARFNREDLVRRIERVVHYRERIELHNLDALDLLRGVLLKPSQAGRAFVYLDPPYFSKGSQLYLNHYTPEDHSALARHLRSAKFTWVMSYDNVSAIRKLYAGYRQVAFSLGYSAREWKIGKELLIIPPHVHFPTVWSKRIPGKFITAADRLPCPLPVEATTSA